MAYPLRQSTASQEVPLGPFLDDTDGKTAETGLTINAADIRLTKHGGTTHIDKTSGGATHDANGIYYCTLDATDTNTLGGLVINVHVAGALPVRVECHVYAPAWFDAMFGTGLVNTNVINWKGSAAAEMTGDAYAEAAAVHTHVNTLFDGTGAVSVKSISAVNSTGDAVVFGSSGANGHGLKTYGNGTGQGIRSVGGATGYGVNFVGGATSGVGLVIEAPNGHGAYIVGGTNSNGLAVTGNGSGSGFKAEGGTTGVGVWAHGGSTSGAAIYADSHSGDGITATGGTNGRGINASGAGTGEGLLATGGTSGRGLSGVGGSSSGFGAYFGATNETTGLRIVGHGVGHGISVGAGATGHGVVIGGGATSGNGLYVSATNGDGAGFFGGTNGRGLAAGGAGTGAGLSGTGGASGNGAIFVGGATTGAGVHAYSQGGNNSGVLTAGFGSGPGIKAEGGATGIGIHAHGGATSGAGLLADSHSGDGITATGGTAGNGINTRGAGTGSGMLAYGGTAGIGFAAFGQGSSHGIKAAGGPTGNGIDAVGGSTSGQGINAQATGGNGNGIWSGGNGTGAGLSVSGGTTGSGLKAQGGSTSGAGIMASATSGDGITAVGAGTGHADINADITGSITGNVTGSVGSIPAVTGATLHADYDAAKTAASQTSVNTIDGIVDSILEDTDVTIPGLIGAIGSGTGSALNFEVIEDNASAPLNGITRIGTATGTYANTLANDGTTHSIASVLATTYKIDVVYGFSVGAGRSATRSTLRANMSATGDTVTVKAYNFVTSAWDTRTTITGTAEVLYDIPLLAGHTGTGANVGKVYLRFVYDEGDAGTLVIDECYTEAQTSGSLVGYSDGAIWVKATGTAASIPYTNGTADNPCPWDNALVIAGILGITRFRIVNGETITLTAGLENSSLIGKNWNLALGGQPIDNCYFDGAKVSGIASADVTKPPIFDNCGIGAVTLPGCRLYQCGIGRASGTFTASAGTGSQYNFIDCFSLVPGSGTPAMTFTGGTTSCGVNIRRFSGGTNIILDAVCTLSLEVVVGGGQTVAVNGADLEIRGTVRSVTLTDITSATVAQLDCIAGPVTLSGVDGTVNVYGICSSVTDSRTGTPVLNEYAEIHEDVSGLSTFDPTTDAVVNVTNITGTLPDVTIAGFASGVEAALAASIEAAMANDVDTTALLQAIIDKFAEAYPDVDELTLGAFATAAASSILVTPENKIATDVDGFVTSENMVDISSVATTSDIDALNNFDPATDVVAHVTLVDRTIENDDALEWLFVPPAP